MTHSRVTDYAAQVEAIAEQLASMVKAAGFDGAISDFEPAWTPEHGAGCESAATVGVGYDLLPR